MNGHPSADGRTPRQPIVGHSARYGLLIGAASGAVGGGLLGAAFARGDAPIPGLAPMVSGGPEVPAFVFGACALALFGLIGAIAGSEIERRSDGAGSKPRSAGGDRGREERASPHDRHGGEAKAASRARHDPKHPPGWIMRLPVAGSVLLVAFMIYTLYHIAAAALGAPDLSDQTNRVTWIQKNVIRLGGAEEADTARAVLRAAYPSTRPENSPAFVLLAPDDWRMALAATPLIAPPLGAAVAIDGNPAARIWPGLQTERPAADDPAAFAAAVDERLAAARRNASAVFIAAADGDFRWAVPAGAYAARTGTPILFVTRDAVPEPTAAALRRRGGAARIHLLGPEAAIPEPLAQQLRAFGEVARIAASDPVAAAVRLAQYRHAASDFGWGLVPGGIRQAAPFNAILVNRDSWRDAVAAAHMARAGKAGPILLTDADRIAPVLDIYLWRHRPAFASTPAEGPFNHLWAVGSFARLSYPVQAWADYSQEIEQYMTFGDSALSGFEGLGFAWLALAIASAAFIVHHGWRRAPEIMPMMRAAWALSALLLGPVALFLYARSYGWPKHEGEDGTMTWRRPLFDQTVSATVMMFGFDMMLMVLAVFAIAYVTGFPVILFNGSLFWLGSAMFLMMVGMYVVALVVMMLVFHTPMTMHHRRIPSYWKAFAAGLPLMVATMSVESLGMMPTMWWAQMLYLPAMQMPTSDDLTMWVTLLMAAFVGFLVVLPFNHALVRRGVKQGTM